jgi:peptide methionine sulfoxide reductase MsrB
MAGLPKDPKEMTEADWKQVLNPKEYNVLRKKGTEPAGTGEYDGFYRTSCAPKLYQPAYRG